MQRKSNFSNKHSMERQVAIVGAGISGLLACKYMLSKGFHPIVFESQSNIGGVWTKAVKTTKLQTTKSLYQFSDFPWPSYVAEDFPNQQTIFNYIHAYAKHFDLLKHIKLNTGVAGIDYEGPSDEEIQSWSSWGGNGEPFNSKGKWKVIVDDLKSHSTEIYQVDFVIICVGRFSGLANIPEFPPNKGPEAFHGKVMHSMDYAAMDDEKVGEFIRGKKVIVVGYQKSALDMAIECAAINGVENPCTVFYRKPRWQLHPHHPWSISFLSTYLSRFGELIVHKPGEGFLLGILATSLSPLRWAYSKLVETYLTRTLRLAKYGMVPTESFVHDVSSCLLATVLENFFDYVEEGKIKLKKAPSFSFCNNGVLVEGETTPIEADVVIFATGFKGEQKLQQIFMSRTFQDYITGSPNASIALYRECIQPRIPQLAVIGFSESISNMFTSEMCCRWIAELLDGTFKLPSIKEMEEDVEKWDMYFKRYCGVYHRRKCVGAVHVWYSDQLCKDMGWNSRRKKGFFTDLFQPYGPGDYVCR